MSQRHENRTAEILSQLPLFSCLGEQELATLVHRMRARSYRKHTIIFEEGDQGEALYIVDSGQVKAYLSDEQGKEIVLSLLGAGSYFGEMALLDDAPRSASVITTQDSKLFVLSGDGFRATLAAHPDIALQLMRGLNDRLRRSTESVKSLALMDVYGRVAHLLLEIAVDEGGRLLIHEKLTHQDIADRVGSSREAISRILKDLKIGGYIAIEGKRIEILSTLPHAW